MRPVSRAASWGVDATDENFGAIADEATIPVLVDIWAPWCGPRRMVSPALSSSRASWPGS